jgi:hypothetical protein
VSLGVLACALPGLAATPDSHAIGMFMRRP